MSFVHLHGHTEYSLLDGLSKVKKLVKAAKDHGQTALAITDHGAMYGAIEFYKTCLEENIKPIIGCEFYVAKRSHTDKEGKVDTEPYHLTVLAKNYQGYKNLMKLVSIAHLEGYYYKPRVDRKLLQEFHEGLIVLSGCAASEFARSLKEDSFKEAEELVQDYLKIFGEGNYFLEVQNHEYKRILKEGSLDPAIRRDLERMDLGQDLLFKAIKELSPKLGIPVVATNDFHYVKLDDAPAQDALVCVQTGKFIKDINRLRMIDVPNFYLKSSEEMETLFPDLPEAIKTSVKIADSIDFEMTLGKPIFPIFKIPTGDTPEKHLRDLCNIELEEKFPENKEYQDRLEYELEVIEAKNFSTYFLIFHDFVRWAHSQKIITNTRGSAAGSLVLHLLGITSLDPIAYKLPFERFMNPLRPKLPDIDCDIADDRRDDIIHYIMDKYGHDKVANIVTFGTMMGRAAIRDIGRVLAMPYGLVDRIAKIVPPPKQGFHKSLDDHLREVPELMQVYKEDPEVKHLIDLAKVVEGTVRHASVHAAGVVISPEPMTEYAPLQRESNGGDRVVTQYDMFSVTEDYGGVGLIKMDLLGIRNLSILGHSVEIVKENRGIEVVLGELPLDDKKTYELLGRGDTMGLFQLEGSGMTRYLVDLKPTNFYDIMAMIALYRPGPLASIPEYVARKHDPSKISYFDPRMKEYMGQSLGLLVYQEDVLLTAIKLAGYDWAEADKLRKAMGKKVPAEMAKEKTHFVEGCVKNGMSQERADELFRLIEPFAAYGFGKAHAASYAMISFQTAFMKANYPVEFMTAVMTAEYGDTEKIANAMEECKRLEIMVLQPDVNKSKVGFAIETVENGKQGIRFGLSAIKNVGILAIESILAAREKGLPAGRQGEFKSLADLCSRVDNRLVNRKALEALIKSGALDEFGTRAAQLLVVDQCLESAHKQNKNKLSGQTSLFGVEDEQELSDSQLKLPQVDELPLDQLLAFEKELLGFYLHEPPFKEELNRLNVYCTHKIGELTDESIGQRVKIGGVVTEVKRVVTKKSGAEMAFIKLSDGVVELEGVVFPTTFLISKSFLETDKVVFITGKIDKREDQMSLVVDKVFAFNSEKTEELEKELSNLNNNPDGDYKTRYRRTDDKPSEPVKKTPKEIQIMVPRGMDAQMLKKINLELRNYPGKSKVSLLLPNGGSDLKKLDLPFGIKLESTLLENIEGMLGKGAIRLT